MKFVRMWGDLEALFALRGEDGREAETVNASVVTHRRSGLGETTCWLFFGGKGSLAPEVVVVSK
jgi:hypothetical protein